MDGVAGTDRADDDLVAGLRRGDVAAFDCVYATYGARIFSFLLRLSRRRDVAEDLAQETWIKIAGAAPTLREDTRLGPFLFTIARNLFVSHRRWSMLDLSRLVVLGREAAGAIARAPDEEHEHSLALRRLETALQSLPFASREVLLLVGVEGLAHDEVAGILGISHEAMRQRLSRARAQLGAKMTSLEKRAQPRHSSKGEIA
jgi:RNA polymerase sigma factor (sigma-70 family)